MDKGNMKRREFFKISSVAGGGLLLGFSWMTSCKQAKVKAPAAVAEALEMPKQWYEMNAYLKIGENGVVTIYSQNPEIGQNVKTSMPMIVAEELDVDWKNVLVEQAGLNSKAFERQVAGGSQSIRQGWETLRKAGATARQMLITAAASQWEVDPKDCYTENGLIIGPEQKRLSYGDVASAAAELEVPEEVQLKDPKDFKIIGQGKGNVDIDGIITGKPLFGLDTKREGMLYACVVRPPAFGQKLDSFEDSEARKLTGVKDVIRFGDKIAVLADSTYSAMKACRFIEPKYEQDKPAESSIDHDKELKALLEKPATEHKRNDGNTDKAFKEADQVVTRVYEAPFLPHNCLEPMNFFADATGEKVIMHGPIQTPAWARSRAAKILERDESEIEVSMTRMGGGFGRRLYGDFSDEAVEISSLAKAPVQLVFSREDDMTAGTYRPASKYKLEAAIKDDKIVGYRMREAAINRNMFDAIAHFFPAGAIPNLQVSVMKHDSNISTGAWRAPYTNFLAFAEQSFFDELAEIMEVDEVQLRMDLLEQAKEPAEKDEKIEYSPARMQDCIRLVADKAGWGKKGASVHQGISAYYSHNTHVAEVAEVEILDGVPTVKKVYCAVDCGIVINPKGAINQIEGGIIDGIGHAMYGDFSFDKGKPSASNFHSYRLIRNQEAPDIEVYFVKSNIAPTGLGEPSLPPAGGAVANALYKATGKRFYKQPFVKETSILG